MIERVAGSSCGEIFEKFMVQQGKHPKNTKLQKRCLDQRQVMSLNGTKYDSIGRISETENSETETSSNLHFYLQKLLTIQSTDVKNLILKFKFLKKNIALNQSSSFSISPVKTEFADISMVSLSHCKSISIKHLLALTSRFVKIEPDSASTPPPAGRQSL